MWKKYRTEEKSMKKNAAAISSVVLAGAAGAFALLSGAAAAGLAHAAVRVDRGSIRPVTVTRIEPGSPRRVWLRGSGVEAPGRHSLLFDSPDTVVPSRERTEATGHARLGPVIARSGGEVARELVQIDRGQLAVGSTGRMVGWWYTSPEELGFRVEFISFDTELGPMDAWLVHPKRRRGNRWAIHTHGRGASPAETFRGIAPLAQAGITSLIICYRNDPGQPAGRNARYGMGIAESRDIDAAIDEAVRRGAKRVTLIGWSMGGTASLVAAERGRHCEIIDGLVLDSPGVDWPEILRAHGKLTGVPAWISDLGMVLLSRGWVASGVRGGVDLASLTPEAFARDLAVPVLLIAGPSDTFVDWKGARQLADFRPDLVQFLGIPEGGHVRLWNMDPHTWEQAVLSFVSALPKP